MAANVRPHLDPGEELQVVFGAQTVSPYSMSLLFIYFVFKNKYRVVAVTNRRILVCDSGRMKATAAKEVVQELPRTTEIGPARGLWYRCDSLGPTLHVHKRYHRDITTADEARTT